MVTAIPPVVTLLDSVVVDVLSVDPGRSFSIVCSSEGNFSGTVTWEHNGIPVQNIGVLDTCFGFGTIDVINIFQSLFSSMLCNGHASCHYYPDQH